jgi:hypothetical protein
MRRWHQSLADFDLQGCLRQLARYLARRLRAFIAELLLHIIAERMDERRARLQLVDRPVREGNGCQREEVVAAAVGRRSRLTRQHEVPQLV